MNSHQQRVLDELHRLVLPPGDLRGGRQTEDGGYPDVGRVDLDAHLTGRETYAVRLAWETDTGPAVRAGVVDVDVDGAVGFAIVHQLVQEAQRHGLAVLPATSGRKGFHVVLFSEPVPEATMVTALQRLRAVAPAFKGELIPGEKPQVKLAPGFHQVARSWAYYFPVDRTEEPRALADLPDGFWKREADLLATVQPTPRNVLAAYAQPSANREQPHTPEVDLVPHLDRLGGQLPPCLDALLQQGGHVQLGTWNQNALTVARYAVTVGLTEQQAEDVVAPLVERPAVDTTKDETARRKNWRTVYRSATANPDSYGFSCSFVLGARGALGFDCRKCLARPAGVRVGAAAPGSVGPAADPFVLERPLADRLVALAVHCRRELPGVSRAVLPTTQVDFGLEPERASLHWAVLQAAASGAGSGVEVAQWLDTCPLDALVAPRRAEQLHRKGYGAPLRTAARAAAVDLVARVLQVPGPDSAEELHLLDRVADLSMRAGLADRVAAVQAGLQQGQAPAAIAAALTAAVEPLQRTAAAAFGLPLTSYTDELLDALERPERPTVDTGVQRLNFLLGGGLAGGKLVVLAGLPGGGKTTLAASIADHAASSGVPVLFVALEMGRGELFDRALARAAGVDSAWIEQRRVDEDTLGAALDRYLTDTAPFLAVEEGDYHTTPDRMAAWVHDARRRYGLAREQPVLVVVDYLQLLQSGDETVDSQPGETVRVSEVAVRLKRLARDTNAAVLALSDVNREEAKTATKSAEITLSALRGSARIGHAADVVVALHTEPAAGDGGKAKLDPWQALSAKLKDTDRATAFLRALEDARIRHRQGGKAAQVYGYLELLKNRGGRGRGIVPVLYQKAFHRFLPGPQDGLDEMEGRPVGAGGSPR